MAEGQDLSKTKNYHLLLLFSACKYMNTQIKDLIEQTQERYLGMHEKPSSSYLNAEELGSLSSYVQSLPERLAVYKLLRDREVEILQSVADRIEREMPQADVADVERGIKNLILVVRYCAMAMTLNDESFLEEKLLKWMGRVARPNTRQIDAVLYKLLNQVLNQELTSSQLGLLQPLISKAQATLT